MGWLGCDEMSSAFIRHLQKRGPISIKAAGNRYWRQHPKGYCTDDDDHKDNALTALELSALSYAEMGLIEPKKRGGIVCEFWLAELTNITPDELSCFIHTASAEEYNSQILMCNEWDIDGNYIWFDPIVWKLTDKAKAHPELLRPFGGVDL
jgi:hypothetical protein